VGYFEEVAKVGDPKEAINWITHELLGQLAYRNEPFKTNPISVAAMQELLSRLKNGELTGDFCTASNGNFSSSLIHQAPLRKR